MFEVSIFIVLAIFLIVQVVVFFVLFNFETNMFAQLVGSSYPLGIHSYEEMQIIEKWLPYTIIGNIIAIAIVGALILKR